MFSRTKSGQATVEAAFAIPILFVLMLMLMQPGIILYDRMVMRHAAAEGTRLLATASSVSGLDSARCKDLVLRQLGAIPPHDLFHMHEGGCSWEIEFEGGESSEVARVSIRNTLRLLPLFDFAAAFSGVADSRGCITISVSESARAQPEWLARGSLGTDPASWVAARKEG